MLRRWHILLLIVVTLAAFCGLAAAKLRATPKYDRVQVGMTLTQVSETLGQVRSNGFPDGCVVRTWDCDEGTIKVVFVDTFIATSEADDAMDPKWDKVTNKSITPRGPLERLAWLAGWRPDNW